MILNREQLLEIKTFIEKKGFTYIDVQMEILDHVASSVEEKMTNKPDLDFENALNQTYKDFGVLGFSVIADGIVNAIRKRYNRFFWKNFCSFFGYKYILLLCLSAFAIYNLQGIIGRENFSIIYVVAMLLITAILLLYSWGDSIYKKYMSYKCGASFLTFLGSFLLFTNFAINHVPPAATIFALNWCQVIASLSVVFTAAYFISGIKTSKIGIRDSRLLMEKYRLLYS